MQVSGFVSAVMMLLILINPVRSSAAMPATPVAAEQCTVEPRTPSAIAEIVTDEDLANATPFALPVAYAAPAGEPADDETVAGVTETVRQLVACTNAGDFLRFLGLFSNDGLRRHGADLGLPLAEDDELLTPSPSSDDDLQLGSIGETIVMSDGRVSVLANLVDTSYPDAPDSSIQFYMSKQEDRWLIDQLIPIADVAEDWTPVSGAAYKGVIVDEETAAEFVKWLTGVEASAGWVPTADQIATAEAALPGYIQQAPNAMPDLWQRLSDYRRQYAGYINADGHSIILINAFCDWEDDDTWMSTPRIVMDGGDCYFNAEYDLDLGAFNGLYINGDA